MLDRGSYSPTGWGPFNGDMYRPVAAYLRMSADAGECACRANAVDECICRREG